MLTYLTGYDFGYTWPWTYGHLWLALIFAALVWFTRNRLPRLLLAGIGLLALWGFVGFLIIHAAFRFNLPQIMPTEHFLAGAARPAPLKVLDVGCGSGRTTLMVALARPQSQIHALDNFSADYIKDNGPDKLKANLRAANVPETRVEVVAADMRHMPLPDAAFDGVVSSYAIDHLNRAGIAQAIHEVARVLKPNGEFLLSNISVDQWLLLVYGPPVFHHVRHAEPTFWQDNFRSAGLEVVETGRQPGSEWFLCRKPASPTAVINETARRLAIIDSDGTKEARQR